VGWWEEEEGCVSFGFDWIGFGFGEGDVGLDGTVVEEGAVGKF